MIDIAVKTINVLHLVGSSLIVLASFSTFYLVKYVRSRKEKFLLVTPFLLFLAGCLGITLHFIPEDEEMYRNVLTMLKLFLAILGIWIFTQQYLLTSLTLPILFTEAKLEWMHDEVAH